MTGDPWLITSSVLGFLFVAAGIDLGLAFLMRGPRAALDDRRD